MSSNPIELSSLIPQGGDSSEVSCLPALVEHTYFKKTAAAVAVLAAIPQGAGRWYATFGPVAMMYAEGLWLIAPVATGAIIAVTDEVVQILTKKYPENQFLRALCGHTFFADKAIGGFLSDFGFAWGSLKSMAALIGGVEYLHNDFAKIWSPMLAFPTALLNRYVRYDQVKGLTPERTWQRHMATFLRGATSSSGVTSTLLIQGMLSPTSWIPTSLNVFLGGLGLAASMLKESFPALSRVLILMIHTLCENPSLAMSFFAFPNDVYAAENQGYVSEDFFYGNVVLSGAFLVLLTLISLRAVVSPTEQAHITAVSDEQDSVYEVSINSGAVRRGMFFSSYGDSGDDQDNAYQLMQKR